LSLRQLSGIALLVGAILLSCASASAAASARTSVGVAPPLPAGAAVTGSTPAVQTVHVTVSLAPRDPAALEAFATAVSTPGSPDFRDYLSVPQFVQRFAPSAAQLAAVEGTLRADGLEVGEPTVNDLTLPISGSAARIESAFHTSLAEVSLAGGRTAYVNRQAPSLPAAVAPYVQAVVGLDDLAPYQAQASQVESSGDSPAALSGAAGQAAPKPAVVTGGPQPCLEAQELKFQGGHTADEIASAYQLPGLYGAGDIGAGQTVGILELEPYLPTDIAAYQSCYGTATPVTAINVGGGPGPYEGDDSEAALDIEQVIGLAPAANILVYQGPNGGSGPVNVLSAMVSENRAKTLTTSWGQCEQFASRAASEAENTLLQEAAAQGQSFYAAAGDTGSEGCLRSDKFEDALAVQSPSSLPFATGVGGTSLTEPGPPPTETVWNDGSKNATGGGTSIEFPMATYQSGAAAGLHVIGTGSRLCGAAYCRQVPDVAADADPNTGYVVYANEEWGQIGGTSAGSPLWAALTALTDAFPSCRGRTVGFANPALYAIAGAAYAANFHDIVAASPFGYANNDPFGEEGNLYPVAPGYDMTTGLGTPVGPTLAASLCAIASPVYAVSVANPGHLTSSTKKPVALQLTATDSGNQPVTYNATGLPAGLVLNPTTGQITGVPTTIATSTVTASATDPFTNVGSTQFLWTIKRLNTVRVSKLKLRGIGTGRPVLSFQVTVGKSSPRLAALKVNLPHGLGFAKAPLNLARGVTITAKHGKRLAAHLKVHGGALAVKLAKPAQKLQVVLHWPGLTESAKPAKQAKKKAKLQVVIGATDTAHHGSRFALSARAR
jgi:subtilase family serine protease